MKTFVVLLIGAVAGVAVGFSGVSIAADAPVTSPAVVAQGGVENKVTIVSTFPGGPKAQKELDEALVNAAKGGWRVVSSSAVLNGSVVSHYIYLERQAP